MRHSDPYTLFPLTDDVMGIGAGTLPNRKHRSRERSKFIAQIACSSFSIGIFTFERPGSEGNWNVAFRLERGDSKSSEGFIGAIVTAIRDAPIWLSCRQTQDAVNSIAFATGRNINFSKALLTAIMPNGTFLTFNSNVIGEGRFVRDAANIILCADSKEELAIVTDMRTFNCRGNSEESIFVEFWDEMTRVRHLVCLILYFVRAPDFCIINHLKDY